MMEGEFHFEKNHKLLLYALEKIPQTYKGTYIYIDDKMAVCLFVCP